MKIKELKKIADKAKKIREKKKKWSEKELVDLIRWVINKQERAL
jgi:hypothetical protein